MGCNLACSIVFLIPDESKLSAFDVYYYFHTFDQYDETKIEAAGHTAIMIDNEKILAVVLQTSNIQLVESDNLCEGIPLETFFKENTIR